MEPQINMWVNRQNQLFLFKHTPNMYHAKQNEDLGPTIFLPRILRFRIGVAPIATGGSDTPITDLAPGDAGIHSHGYTKTVGFRNLH